MDSSFITNRSDDFASKTTIVDGKLLDNRQNFGI